MSRDEVCRGLPKILMSELTILCKPVGACWKYAYILTVINLHFIKPAKNLSVSDINKFYIVYCACILYLKLLKRNQGAYKTG